MERLSQSKSKLFASLLHKKYRYKHGLFLAEGKKCARESIISGIPAKAFVAKSGFSGELTNLPEHLVYEATEEQFHKLTDQTNPEGILTVLPFNPPERLKGNYTEGPAILLDGLQDPGNVGAILRVADWFGIKKVILSPGTVDPWHPKVVRASMGSLFRMNLQEIAELETWTTANANQLVIADLQGEMLGESRPNSTDILVIGNEARGVSEIFRSTDGIRKLRIPGGDDTESLNAAVATGIMVWEWLGKRS